MTTNEVFSKVSAGYFRGYEYARRCHEEQAGEECLKWLREMIKREPTSDFDVGVRDYMVTHGLFIVEEAAPIIAEDTPAGLVVIGLLGVGVVLVAAGRYLGLL